MPTFDDLIADYVVGDGFSIERTIPFAPVGEPEFTFPAGTIITKAWLTVKAKHSDEDDPAHPTKPSILQKVITTSDVPGTGQIENDGTGDTDFVVRFDLTATDTQAIGTKIRVFDIQVLTAAGIPHTPNKGKIYGLAEVTKATS